MSHKGFKVSKDTLIKLSNAMKKRWANGMISPLFDRND